MLETPTASPHLGRRAQRVEDRPLLTGRGRFGDDAPMRAGTLHAAVLRSPHAHARLLAVRYVKVMALAVDKARYAGDPVAMVVAVSRYLAEDAPEKLEADYESLPPVADIRAAITKVAPMLHEKVGSNVVSDSSFRYGDPEQTFALAKHRVALTVEYSSSELYTFSIDLLRPDKLGHAGINTRQQVVRLDASDVDNRVAPGVADQIIADLCCEEAFEGHWKHEDANAKSLRGGWYFTGDTGYLDEDGDLFVTGRVDDMIISGGENISPVDIESVISLCPGFGEVAVAGEYTPLYADENPSV